MVSLLCCRRWSLLLFALAAGSRAAASEAANVLPGGTDLVLTLNVRQLLAEPRIRAAVGDLLEPWRLALRGDEQKLREYHQARDLLRNAGITEEDFLDRSRTFRSFSESLGLNLLEDVDRVTLGLHRGDPGSWIVLVEGRFKKGPLPPESRFHRAVLGPKLMALTGRKREMDCLQARASGAKGGALSPAVGSLLAKADGEQVVLVADRVDALLAELAEVGVNSLAKLMAFADNTTGKRILDQIAARAREAGQEITCASVGLSVREEGSRLHLGLVCKNAERGRSLAGQLDRGKVGTALAVRLIDGKLARRLGDILLRAEVIGTGETVVVRMEVPPAFIQEVVSESAAAIHPSTERVWRQIMSIPLWGPAQPPPAGALAVEEVRDVPYRSDAAADPIRHRLDLFVPRGKRGVPVVVVVHGGGWVMGDNRCCGLQSSVGHFLASQGFLAVLPNYRLSPLVTHPEHVKDVARAVRWTRDHIAEHGGDPDRIYLLGHSAGGHLVALLATDESYLRAEGLRTRDLRGVIAVSGVYRIAPGAMEAFLGGSGSRSFRPDQFVPLRGGGLLPVLPPLGVSVKEDVFGPPFGANPKVRASASPVNHVRRGLPPFLLLVAENDLPTLASLAEEFHQALCREGCSARLLKVADRNHNSLLFSAITPEDPAARAMLEFLGKP
jgi:arylformamidase